MARITEAEIAVLTPRERARILRLIIEKSKVEVRAMYGEAELITPDQVSTEKDGKIIINTSIMTG